jgi:hypothetical protein
MLSAEWLQQTPVLLGEEAGLAAPQVEYPDGPVFGHQRDGQLRANTLGGLDVARIPLHVGNEHGFFGLGGGTHNPLAHAKSPVFRHLFAEAHRHLKLELAANVVHQQDAEGVVVDKLLQTVGHPPQTLLQVRGGIDLLCDREETRQGVRLLTGVETCGLGRGCRPGLHGPVQGLGSIESFSHVLRAY